MKNSGQTHQEEERENSNNQNKLKKKNFNGYCRNMKNHENNTNNYTAKEFDNLEEMNNFLETCRSSKMNQEEIDNLNSPITRNEIEYVI